MTMKGRGRVAAAAEDDGKEKVVDLSGLSLDSLPAPSLNLAFITRLDLSNNNLQSISESLMARLLHVEVFDVHSNQLQALPNSIGCLSKLKILNISGNLIKSLPKTIENCRALQELNANFNQLTLLPDTIGFELINLRKLSVNSNMLTFLPSSTSHMTALHSLDARLNRLRSLPNDLENLIRLQSLDLSQNFHHLSSLPYSLGLLLSLSDLDVSYNSITVLPDSIACLTKLRKFSAEGNPLVCPPPEVVKRGVEEVQKFLRARMNGAVKARRGSWIGRLVRHKTFSGGDRGQTIPSYRMEDSEEFSSTSSEYRLLDGLATPKRVGLFSPRRLFSPQRSLPSSPARKWKW